MGNYQTLTLEKKAAPGVAVVTPDQLRLQLLLNGKLQNSDAKTSKTRKNS